MFTVQLTSYGQALVSSLVNIDGIILLYDTIADISSVTSTSSYTVQLDEEACGNLNKNVGNVKVQDSRSNEYIAKTILFYVLNGGEKKIVAGYSQDAAIVQKGSSPLTVFLSFDFSVFTNGFLFSSIQAGYGNAAHNTDGIVHIENPDISTDDAFSVYNKAQVDALLQNKQSTLEAGEGIAITDDTVKTTGIPFGICDNTSTATAFTVTVPGIYKLEDGVCCLVKNGVITSASGFTLNVNGLGGKPVYSNMAAATRETTLFNIAYTMLFVYDSTRVDGGCWICYRGYFSDANSIAYQIRGNVHTLQTTAKFYRYRLLFTSADGTHFVPSNTSTSTNATAKRDVVQTPIDPFGEIVYYSTTTAVEANANPGPTYLWTQYAVTFGYSFNRTGAALTLTSFSPVYIKCAPQSNGSAIIDADTPYVQALPNTADGKIYIFLGVANSATAVELLNNHPIYYHDGTGIRIWHGKDSYSKSELDTIIADYVQTSRTINNKPLSSDITLTLDDVSDGTNRSIPTVNNSTITIKKNSSDTGDSFTTNAASGKIINLGLATVATSGSYNDLSDKPTATVINDSTITIKKNSDDAGDSFTTNNATAKTINLGLHTVASSGSYNDLSNKPTIPTVNDTTITIKKNTSDTGDSFTTNTATTKTINLGLSTVATSGSYNDLSNKPTIPTVNNAKLTIKKDTNDTGTEFTANASSDVTCNLGLHAVATSGSYNDLSSKPTIPTVNNSTITIKKNSSDTGDSFTTNAASGKTINLGLATVATSGSYNDLSNKPTIPVVPEDVSAFNNDAGYLTSYTETDPTVPSWAKQPSKPTYTASEVGALPSTTVIPTVNNSTITIKKNSSDTGDSFTTNASSAKTINLGLSTVATSGSYNDLSNKPTIPTVNNAKLTIKKNASDTGTEFTANASSDVTCNLNLATVATSGSYNDLSNKPTIPADTGDLTNNAGFITSSDLPTNHVTTDTAQEITGAKTIAEDKLKIGDTTTNEDIDNFVFKRGQEFIVGTQSSATSLWHGATSQPAIYEGMCINYLVPVACTSTAVTLELTLPDNTTTGAIPVRRNAANTVTSTHIGVGSVVQLTLLLNRTVGSTTYEKVWKMNESYDSNTNTIAYQLRGNSALLPASDTSRYYKLFFSSADNTKWVPASINSSNNTTTARTANQRPINPFGRIAYTSATTSYTAGTNVAAATLWDQYTINLGYSFGTLSLTPKLPVYIKCAPQSDGSAIIDSTTPVVQSLPSSADNKIYIFLGTAYGSESTTQTIEMFANKPVYYHDGNGIKLWTGSTIPSKTSDLTNDSGFITSSNIPTNVSQLTNDANYITSADIPTNVSYFTNDAGYLTSFTETDPTVPSWAKQSSKPSYTLDEVSDGSTRKLSNYEFKSNLKEGAYINVDETTMTSSSTNLPTSKAVASYISGLGYITTETDPTVPSWAKASSKPSYTLDEVTDGTTRKLSDYVPTSRTINSKALTSNITLTLDDVADGTNRSIPTNTNQLTNGAGFITSSDLPTNHVTTDTDQTISGQKTVSGLYFNHSVANYTFLANSIYSSQSTTLEYKTASNGQHIFYFGNNSLISMNKIADSNAAEFYVVGKISISATVSGAPSYSINVGANNAVVFGGATIESIRVTTDNETNLGTSAIAYKNIYAYKFIKKGGTSSQFLKADGSVDSNSYATTSQIPSVPTTVSSFTNDAGYITSSSLTDYVKLATTDRENQTIESSVTIHPKHNTYNNYRVYVFDGTDLSARTSVELVSWELDANNTKHSIQLSIRPEPYAGTYSVDHYEPAEYIRLSTIEDDQISRSLLWITKEFDANSSRFNVYGDSVASYSSISGASLNDGRLTTVDYVNAKSKPSNWYAVCSTGASTKAKKITIPGFTLETGAKVTVKFTATNSASAPTLTVNDGTTDSEAKPICYRGTSAVTTGNYYKWQANDILDLVYDGTNWIIVGWQTYVYYSTVASYATYVGNGSSGYVAYSNNGSAGSRALLPRVDVTTTDWVDLGSTAKRWKTLYLTDSINDGTNTFSLPDKSGTLAVELGTYVVSSSPLGSSLIQSGKDYRQTEPSGTSFTDNPKWRGKDVSIGISQYIDLSENSRISIYVPHTTYVGSIAFLSASGASTYSAYPLYFRGDTSAHNATVPGGSILRLTFREDAFYNDFYDLADFGVEHEPIVRVGKLPHQLTAENYNGALVGVRADNGKLDKVLAVTKSGTTVTETLTNLHSSSPIYVSFMHECFSAHPRVPFGLILNLDYIYNAGGSPEYGNMPFLYIENGSIVSSSSSIQSHVITSSTGKRYFHVNNAPVYLSYRPFGPNDVYISIGGPYSGYVGKDGTTLIGFLPSDESEAGLLRLVNCFTPDNYAAEAGSASTADFASKAYTLQAGNSASSSTCLCGGNIINSYVSIQPGGGTTNQNNALDLGNTTNRWRNIYVNGKTTNYYFEIGNDTTNVVAQPVVRPNTNGYGYLGTSSYHLNAAYINNLYLTSNGTSIATYIGSQIADKVSGTGVGSICLLNVSITNSSSSVATVARGSLLNSNSNLSVSTLSIASPHLVTASSATPSSYSNTVGCYYSGTASGTSGAYKLLSSLYVPASATKRYIVLAIRVS